MLVSCCACGKKGNDAEPTAAATAAATAGNQEEATTPPLAEPTEEPTAAPSDDEGDGVAIENLPWKNCHTAKNIRAIVDRLDSPFAGGCWDTGHAHCNRFPPSEMKDLGDKLVTLHIQDSVGMDDHLIPYYGHYDWESFIHTLREMNYKGEFVLEAHHQMLEVADDPEKQNKLLAEMLEVSNRIMQLP